MKIRKIGFLAASVLAVMVSAGCEVSAPTRPDPVKKPERKDEPKAERETYNIYLGNTHSHSTFSGDVKDAADSVAALYKTAREAGYDFYAVTDHSQYDTFTGKSWDYTKNRADAFTTASFVAIRGYEHSENNGPDAKGHMNVYNSSEYLNALADGINMKYFQDWLSERTRSQVVVSMNHPDKDQYNKFHCYNNSARNIIKLIELINGNTDYHGSFVVALSSGWKVSPVAGCDNHALSGVKKWVPRTGLAAKSLSYNDLLDAMRSRRTYATFDTNLKCIYYVNNFDMGSEFAPADGPLQFHIEVSDPDTGNAGNKISRLEIIGENDKLVEGKDFSSHSVTWDVSVSRGQSYYYVKVYNASSASPIAYLAPVWITE